MSAPRLLAVSHDASASGAPHSLLAFLRWLKEETDTRISILLMRGGPLQESFEQIGDTFSLRLDNDSKPAVSRPWVDFIPGLKPCLQGYKDSSARAWLKRQDYSMVLVNTLAAHRFVHWLDDAHRPIVCYAREMGVWMKDRLNPEDIPQLDRKLTGFIANSTLVRDYLTRDYGVDPDRIGVFNPSISLDRNLIDRKVEIRQRIREQLGIPDEAILVGGCGVNPFLKGTDLFVQIAGIVERMNASLPFQWVWIGSRHNAMVTPYIDQDAHLVGLDGCIHILGSQPNATEYFAACDLFAMTSREEPFGRVVLEAGAMGVPSICFDKTCGAADLIQRDCGSVVPYLDLAEFAKAILELGTDLKKRKPQSEEVPRLVREEYTTDTAAPKLWKYLKEIGGLT